MSFSVTLSLSLSLYSKIVDSLSSTNLSICPQIKNQKGNMRISPLRNPSFYPQFFKTIILPIRSWSFQSLHQTKQFSSSSSLRYTSILFLSRFSHTCFDFSLILTSEFWLLTCFYEFHFSVSFISGARCRELFRIFWLCLSWWKSR